MMKICSNCGKQMEDSEKFCIACGAAQGADTQQAHYAYDQSMTGAQSAVNAQQPVAQNAKKRKKLWLIPVIIVGVLSLVAGVAAPTIVKNSGRFKNSGRSEEDTIKEYFEAISEKDADAVVDLLWSKSMLEVADELYDMDKEELIIEWEGVFINWDYEVKYKNLEIENIDAVDKDDVNYFVEEIGDEYDTDIKIDKMCIVEVSYEMWSDYYEAWKEVEEEIVLYKSSGKWYILDCEVYDYSDEFDFLY